MYYGCSTDLLGLLIARIEGAPLGEVLRRRIFDPLGMKDTSFLVPGKSGLAGPLRMASTKRAG
jgi:CubicO group peptidase (beta-lactamase class C family)